MKTSVKKILSTALLMLLIINGGVFAEELGKIDTKRVAVVGDSYAGYFNHTIGNKGYEYFIFPIGTIYNPLNQEVFEQAINSDNDYILFATGVNDQALNTDLSVFERELRRRIEEIRDRKKFLFVHSYMDYPNKKVGYGSSPPDEYDKILRRLADEYDNVIYIDMSYFAKTNHGFGDGLHYDKFFYETLSSKLRFYIYSIERTYSKTTDTISSKMSKRQIAVAGDLAAYEFFSFENKKDYVMTNFTTPVLSLSQSKDQVFKAINFDAQSVFITSGIKDYEAQTNLDEFKDALRECLNEASKRCKNIFLYASIDYDKSRSLPYGSSLYDLAIEDVANEYPNACFINLRNYSKESPQIYDTLYALIDAMIKKIN